MRLPSTLKTARTIQEKPSFDMGLVMGKLWLLFKNKFYLLLWDKSFENVLIDNFLKDIHKKIDFRKWDLIVLESSLRKSKNYWTIYLIKSLLENFWNSKWGLNEPKPFVNIVTENKSIVIFIQLNWTTHEHRYSL